MSNISEGKSEKKNPKALSINFLKSLLWRKEIFLKWLFILKNWDIHMNLDIWLIHINSWGKSLSSKMILFSPSFLTIRTPNLTKNYMNPFLRKIDNNCEKFTSDLEKLHWRLIFLNTDQIPWSCQFQRKKNESLFPNFSLKLHIFDSTNFFLISIKPPKLPLDLSSNKFKSSERNFFLAPRNIEFQWKTIFSEFIVKIG